MGEYVSDHQRRIEEATQRLEDAEKARSDHYSTKRAAGTFRLEEYHDDGDKVAEAAFDLKLAPQDTSGPFNPAEAKGIFALADGDEDAKKIVLDIIGYVGMGIWPRLQPTIQEKGQKLKERLFNEFSGDIKAFSEALLKEAGLSEEK